LTQCSWRLAASATCFLGAANPEYVLRVTQANLRVLGLAVRKKRALIVEDSLEKVATPEILKMMQVYDDTQFKDLDGKRVPFPEQFTRDYVVFKVDAHSNLPIFTEDLRQLAFNLFKGASY